MLAAELKIHDGKDSFMKDIDDLRMAQICGAATILLMLLVSFVDVRDIGPAGTSIGLSHINEFVHNLSPENILFYNITGLFGIVAILTVLLVAALGLLQLLKRKSILKVDTEILATGTLYVVLIGLYVFFEVVIINYRPVIMPGETAPEASFPSSHTMLVTTVMGSAIMLVRRYVSDGNIRRILKYIFGFIIVVTVIGRLLSGVHWFTDIVAGVLISMTMLSLYSWVLKHLKRHHIEYII